MQASKIVIGQVYALKRHEQLYRFRVDAVITRRDSSSGNPYSQVEGYVLEDYTEKKKSDRVTIKPSQLDGLYTDHVELVKRQQHEEALKKEKEALDRAEQEAWRDFFYRLTNAEKPEDADDYRQPFRLGRYGSCRLDIKEDGVALLIEWFKDNGIYKEPGVEEDAA